MKASKRPRYYFSFRSPYSWIASRILADRLSPEEREPIEFIPYWEPTPQTLEALREQGGDFLYRPMSREKHLYILQDVKRLTRSLNLTHVWPIDRNPVWELPVLAYLVAEQCGRAEIFRTAVYRARWEEGVDIHTPDVLVRLAADCGVDPQEVREAPESPAVREKAVSLLLRAWNDDVFGIPYFLLGHDRYWGVDRLAGFLAALRGQPFRFSLSADGESPSTEDTPLPPEIVQAVGSLNTDTVGGCG